MNDLERQVAELKDTVQRFLQNHVVHIEASIGSLKGQLSILKALVVGVAVGVFVNLAAVGLAFWFVVVQRAVN
jgi:hypothetical protein